MLCCIVVEICIIVLCTVFQNIAVCFLSFSKCLEVIRKGYALDWISYSLTHCALLFINVQYFTAGRSTMLMLKLVGK